VSDQRERALEICEVQPSAELCFPFGEATAVFKLGGKIFAWISLDGTPGAMNLKIEPELMGLLTQHPAIRPGRYTDHRNWVTVTLDGTVPDQMLTELIEDSHAVVFSGLPRRVRATLATPDQIVSGT